VVVYGGGFQPFHAGHLSSYHQAKKAFPHADFYVAASNDTKNRPIPFEDKKFLAQQAGVKDEFVEVKNPLNPKEILSNYDPDQDVFVLVRSERDPMSYTKKDGSPGYYQPLSDKADIKPFSKHGYVLVTKKHDFNLDGNPVFSGTQVRDLYTNADDEGKMKIISQLYPGSKKPKTIKKKLDQYLGGLTEGDNPNFFGGSSMSAIPGTPEDLNDTRTPTQKRHDAIRAHKQEVHLQRWMGHRR
jgi:cytidyltransferase-like protein